MSKCGVYVKIGGQKTELRKKITACEEPIGRELWVERLNPVLCNAAIGNEMDF